MSKNVKVNDTNYSGVSAVELPLSDGSGNAQFKDVDEITTPSGSISIYENGTYDVSKYASALVDVAVNVDSGEGDGVKKYSFTLEEDVALTAYTTNEIVVLEENTDLDIVNDTYAAFVVFSDDTTSDNPLYVFTPAVKYYPGEGANFSKNRSIMVFSGGTYAKLKELVQVSISTSTGALILVSYSSGGACTIPAGTYTVFVVKIS